MDIHTTTPSAPGALAGFEAICPICQMALRNTNESTLRLDVDSHLEWHQGSGR